MTADQTTSGANNETPSSQIKSQRITPAFLSPVCLVPLAVSRLSSRSVANVCLCVYRVCNQLLDCHDSGTHCRIIRLLLSRLTHLLLSDLFSSRTLDLLRRRVGGRIGGLISGKPTDSDIRKERDKELTQGPAIGWHGSKR